MLAKNELISLFDDRNKLGLNTVDSESAVIWFCSSKSVTLDE